MDGQPSYFLNTRTRKSVFFLSILVAAFWIAGLFVKIYSYAIVGAIFEILWLPAMALTFILPTGSFIFWVKEKFILKSLYLAAFIINLASILLLMFYY